MKWNIHPLGDRVLINPIEDKVETFLVVPDNAKQKPIRGEILAIGVDVDATQICVGDSVLYGKYAGTEIPNGRDVLILMHQTDVLAVVTEVEEELPAGSYEARVSSVRDDDKERRIEFDLGSDQ